MTFDQLGDYFNELGSEIAANVPDIVAETATEYYKERFTEKAFDGDRWPQAKTPKRTGSLMVESGALVNSIQPSYIGTDKVVISAGNQKVDYAQAHNEGFNEPVTIPAHTRRTRKGIQNVSSHMRRMNITQRQFMGEAKELEQTMIKRLENFFKALLP